MGHYRNQRQTKRAGQGPAKEKEELSVERPQGENKMGVMPVNRLLLNMAIPIMISMMVQAFYNVVDSYFVSQLSQDALNAVSLAFPVQNLMIAVSVGTAVGVNALLARSLGQGDQEKVNRTAVNGVFLTALSCLVFVVLGLTCSRLFYTVQTDIEGIISYGADYLCIVCGASIGLFFAVLMERLLQATGRTFYTMIAQAVGAITNIILDPILIFGLGPFPRMEVAGAALATVIGQILGCCVSILFNATRNPEITMSFKGFRPHGQTIREIYSVGLPSIVMQSIGSVMVFGMNQILIAFTDTATAVFGVYFKLQSFFFMPVFGLNNGMVPIVAYNFGARKPDRIVKTIKLAVMYATILMVIGFTVFQVFPGPLLEIFQSEADAATGDLLAIGIPALRIISFSWLLAGFDIVATSVFQALDHGILSLIGSLVRQLVVLLPVAFLLSRAFGLEAVWLAFPIAELFSAALCTVFIHRLYRRDILPLRAPAAE